IAFEPEHLPRPPEGDENLLGRVAMQRRTLALRRVANIRDGKSRCRRLDLWRQVWVGDVLDDAHADHVDDLALIARDLLVEKSDLRPNDVAQPRRVVARHRLGRNRRRRLTAQAGIDIGHPRPPIEILREAVYTTAGVRACR